MEPVLQVHRVSSGEFWLTALRESFARAKQSSWWSHLEPSESQANDIFKTNSMICGLIYDLLVIRFRTWPYRLSDLIHGDRASQEEAASIFWTASACQLDTYSVDLRSRLAEPSDLLSVPVQNELRMVLSSLTCNTYDTERLHSRNLRRLRSRAHTHRMTLADIGLPHMGFTSPRPVAPIFATFMAEESKIRKGKAAPNLPRSNTSKGKDRDPDRKPSETGEVDDELPGQKRRKAGAGGAWRAYCHLQGQGRAVNFGLLAASYKRLDETSKQQYATVGKLATQAASSGVQAFPDTLWAANRKHMKDAVPVAPPRNASLLAEDSLHGVGLSTDTDRVHPAGQVAIVESPCSRSLSFVAQRPQRSSTCPSETPCLF